MLSNGGYFVQVPSNGVYHEDELKHSKLEMFGACVTGFRRHREDVQDQEDDELTCLDDTPCARDDQSILVQDRCPPRVVQRNASILVVIR